MTQPPTGPWRPAGPTPPPGYQPHWPQPPRPRPAWERLWPLWVVLGVVAVAFVSCTALLASSGGEGPSAGATPVAVATPSATAAPDVVPTQPPATQEAVPQPTEQAAPPPASAEPVLVTVPDVVGIDLQSAQETLFPPLRSTSVDATGRGRLQLWDRNWVVVRQDPPAGAQVPVLTDVKLYVVKEGERAP